MQSIGIIPARGGSKGILNKNTKLMNNKPLIAYTLEAAKKSELDFIVVSTDDDKIINIAKEYGVQAIRRPPEISKDDSMTVDALFHAMQILGIDKYDTVITLQPTSPLRNYKDINESIKKFYNSDCDSLVSVQEIPHNFNPEKIMRYDGEFLHGDTNIKMRQDIDKLYARNGAAIYISKTELILGRKILGKKILPYFMNKINSFDIDDNEDWQIVSSIIRAKEKY